MTKPFRRLGAVSIVVIYVRFTSACMAGGLWIIGVPLIIGGLTAQWYWMERYWP